MNGKTLKFVQQMKIAIFIFGILAVTCIECYKVYADDETVIHQAIDLFWPPDMIPHPHIPDEPNPGHGIG